MEKACNRRDKFEQKFIVKHNQKSKNKEKNIITNFFFFFQLYSRSHSIFTVLIHTKEASPDGEDVIKVGKL